MGFIDDDDDYEDLDPLGQSPEEELRDQREGLRRAVGFFGNKGKVERELLCCAQFLRALNVPFDECDLVALEQINSPPDVLFQDVRFEVTELMDEGRKRGEEYRTKLIEVEAATSPLPRWEFFEPRLVTLEEIALDVMARALPAKSLYAPQVRTTLDLLVYYNVERMAEDPSDVPDVPEAEASGFRSLLIWTGSIAWVVYASPLTPLVLRQFVGQAIRQKVF